MLAGVPPPGIETEIYWMAARPPRNQAAAPAFWPLRTLCAVHSAPATATRPISTIISGTG